MYQWPLKNKSVLSTVEEEVSLTKWTQAKSQHSKQNSSNTSEAPNKTSSRPLLKREKSMTKLMSSSSQSSKISWLDSKPHRLDILLNCMRRKYLGLTSEKHS